MILRACDEVVLHFNGACASTKQGAYELDLYLSNKHDELLAKTLQPGTYKKRFSWVIVDGFAVEITDDQVNFFFFSGLMKLGYYHDLKTRPKPICLTRYIRFPAMTYKVFYCVTLKTKMY